MSDTFIVWGAIGAIIVALVALNIWYARDRARMTPEQRAAEDEETTRDLQIW